MYPPFHATSTSESVRPEELIWAHEDTRSAEGLRWREIQGTVKSFASAWEPAKNLVQFLLGQESHGLSFVRVTGLREVSRNIISDAPTNSNLLYSLILGCDGDRRQNW